VEQALESLLAFTSRHHEMRQLHRATFSIQLLLLLLLLKSDLLQWLDGSILTRYSAKEQENFNLKFPVHLQFVALQTVEPETVFLGLCDTAAAIVIRSTTSYRHHFMANGDT
jgi:hypothetical protein